MDLIRETHGMSEVEGDDSERKGLRTRNLGEFVRVFPDEIQDFQLTYAREHFIDILRVIRAARVGGHGIGAYTNPFVR